MYERKFGSVEVKEYKKNYTQNRKYFEREE